MANFVTKNQQAVYDCIVRMKKETGMWPTYRELAKELGYPLSYVYMSVSSLVKKDKVKRFPNRTRGLRIPGI
ncbi:MAG: hypothetical protein PVF49_08250 [Anaerolineales bacterium]